MSVDTSCPSVHHRSVHDSARKEEDMTSMLAILCTCSNSSTDEFVRYL